MRRRHRSRALLLCALLLWSCGSEEPAGKGDAASAESDGTGADGTGLSDTTGDADGSAPQDAATPDAATPDANTADTSAAEKDADEDDSSDVSPVDAAPSDAGGPDVGLADAGPGASDAAAEDVGADTGADVAANDAKATDGAGGCQPQTTFDYTCDATKPKTCPGGACLFGICVGPKLDQERWKDCGDGTCGACESQQTCPADCGGLPKLTGAKAWDKPAKTITVWVHGFSNKSPAELKKKTYGSAKSCGDIHKMMQAYGIKLPCGDSAPGDKAANQFVAVEYYGAKSPAWMSAKDIKEVESWPFTEGAKGLQRYALIVAKFIRHRLKSTGAQYVNLACHSMGCLITRHLIENNYENLATENRLVRWATNTGVIAGARLARLYDNPTIQQGAKALGLELGDFVLMNPDYVMDVTAWWDHKLYAGNNPLFAGMLIHHTTATNPKIQQALGVQLLDLNNPGDEPNDGIMYTLDQHFHSQSKAASAKTKAGKSLASTHSYAYFDHMANPESPAAGLLAAAGLFHKRKVVITLESVELLSDLEKDNLLDFKNNGEPPAEISVETQVRYDPYVKTLTGKSVLVSEQRVAHRSAELFTMKEKTTAKPGLVLYAGPVFDAQKAVSVVFNVLEVDWYPRFGVQEWLLDPHQTVIGISATLPLTDKVHTFKNANAVVKVRVAVHQMY